MAFSGFTGPIVSWYRGRTQSGGVGDNNPDGPAPDMSAFGYALMDVRDPFAFQPGQGAERPFYGFLLGGNAVLIDAAPSTLAADNIAAAQVPVAGTAVTLVAASGAGVTVGVSITKATTGASVTGLLALDTAMAGVELGTSGSMNLWDPTKAISRAVSITSVGDDSAATFVVAGYDLYGYPLSETITGANATAANGVKTFKYIASVTPAGTLSGSDVTVGTQDVFGLPLRTDRFGYLTIFWNNTLITASTGFTAAVTTDPATATTGDVRGKYGVQTAADGTKRLQVFWRPMVANLSETGMFGVSQFGG